MAYNLLFNFRVHTLADSIRVQKNKEKTNKLIENLLATPYSIQAILCGFIDLVTKINKQDSICRR